MNPVNYIKGLFAEADAFDSRGETERAQEVHDEIAEHLDSAKTQLPDDLAYAKKTATTSEGKVLDTRELVELRELAGRVNDYAGYTATARKKRGAPRNAAAPAAPNTADAPAS